MKKLTKVTLAVSLLIAVIVVFLIFSESNENDSLPNLLTSNVKMEKVGNEEKVNSDYRKGDPCLTSEKLDLYIKALSLPNTNRKQVTCVEFQLGNDTKVYFINYPTLIEGQRLLLARKGSPLKEIFILFGEYPGNKISEVEGNGEGIVFKYRGWNNPEKLIKISLEF